jgi:hypothetical protein
MSLKLTKLEVARRQLATAIELWFYEKDQVSIHTLAAAAYEVIHSVSKKHGRKIDLLFDSICVRDEYRREFRQALNKPANFFKHADKDSDGTIEFNPVVSEPFIIFAILGLNAIGIHGNKHELAFWAWLCLRRPELLTQVGKEAITEKIPIDVLAEINTVSKGDFFEAYLQR